MAEMETSVSPFMMEDNNFSFKARPKRDMRHLSTTSAGSVKSTKSLYFTDPDASGTMARDEEMTLDIYDIYSDDPADTQQGGKISRSEVKTSVITNGDVSYSNGSSGQNFIMADQGLKTSLEHVKVGNGDLNEPSGMQPLSFTGVQQSIPMTTHTTSETKHTQEVSISAYTVDGHTTNSVGINGLTSSEPGSNVSEQTPKSKKKKAPPPPKATRGAFQVKSSGLSNVPRASSSGSLHDDQFKQALTNTLTRKIEKASSEISITSTPSRQDSVPDQVFSPKTFFPPATPITPTGGHVITRGNVASPSVTETAVQGSSAIKKLSDSPQHQPGDGNGNNTSASPGYVKTTDSAIETNYKQSERVVTTTYSNIKSSQVRNSSGSEIAKTDLDLSSWKSGEKDNSKSTEKSGGDKMIIKQTTESKVTQSHSGAIKGGVNVDVGLNADHKAKIKAEGPGKFQIRYKEGPEPNKVSKFPAKSQKELKDEVKEKKTIGKLNTDNYIPTQNGIEADTVSISSTSTTNSILRDEKFKSKISGLFAGGKRPDASASAPSSLHRPKKKKFELVEIPLEETSPRDQVKDVSMPIEEPEDFGSNTFPRDNKKDKGEQILSSTPTSPYEEIKEQVEGGTVGRLVKDIFWNLPLTGRAIDPSTLERKKPKPSTGDSGEKKFKFVVEGIDTPDRPDDTASEITLGAESGTMTPITPFTPFTPITPLTPDSIDVDMTDVSEANKENLQSNTVEHSEDISSLKRMEKKGFSYLLDHKLAADIKRRAGDFTARKPHETVEEKVKGQQKQVAQKAERESLILVEAKAKLQKSDSFNEERANRISMDPNPESAVILEAKAKLNKQNSGNNEININAGKESERKKIKSSMLMEAKAKLQKTKTDTHTESSIKENHTESSIKKNQVKTKQKPEKSSPFKDKELKSPKRDNTEVERISEVTKIVNVSVSGITSENQRSEQNDITSNRTTSVKSSTVSTSSVSPSGEKGRNKDLGTHGHDVVTEKINSHASESSKKSGTLSQDTKVNRPSQPQHDASYTSGAYQQKRESKGSEVTLLQSSVTTPATNDQREINKNISLHPLSPKPSDPPDSAYYSDATVSPNYNYKNDSEYSPKLTSPIPEQSNIVVGYSLHDQKNEEKGSPYVGKTDFENSTSNNYKDIADGQIKKTPLPKTLKSDFTGVNSLREKTSSKKRYELSIASPEGEPSINFESISSKNNDNNNINKRRNSTKPISQLDLIDVALSEPTFIRGSPHATEQSWEERDPKKKQWSVSRDAPLKDDTLGLLGPEVNIKQERTAIEKPRVAAFSVHEEDVNDRIHISPEAPQEENYNSDFKNFRGNTKVRREILVEDDDAGSSVSFASSTAYNRRAMDPGLHVHSNYNGHAQPMYSPGASSYQSENTYSSLSVPINSPTISRTSSISTAAHDTFEYSRPDRGRPERRAREKMARSVPLAPLSISIHSPEPRDMHRSTQPLGRRSRSESRTPQPVIIEESYHNRAAPVMKHEQDMFRMSQPSGYEMRPSHHSQRDDRHRVVRTSYEQPQSYGPTSGHRHPHDRMRGREESFNSASSGPRSPPGRYLRVDESRGGRVPIYNGRMTARDLEGFEYSQQTTTGAHYRKATTGNVLRVNVDRDANDLDANSAISEPVYGVTSGKYSVYREMERMGMPSDNPANRHPDLLLPDPQQHQSRKRRVYQVSNNTVNTGGIQTLNSVASRPTRVRSPEVTAVDPQLQDADKRGDKYNITLKLNALGSRPGSQNKQYERYEEQMNSLNNNMTSRSYQRGGPPYDGYDSQYDTDYSHRTHVSSVGHYDNRPTSPADSQRHMTLVRLKEPQNEPTMEGQYMSKSTFKVHHDAPPQVVMHGTLGATDHNYMIKSVNGTNPRYVSEASIPSPNSPISPSNAPTVNGPHSRSEPPRFTMTVNQTMTMDYVGPEDDVDEDPLNPTRNPNNRAPPRKYPDEVDEDPLNPTRNRNNRAPPRKHPDEVDEAPIRPIANPRKEGQKPPRKSPRDQRDGYNWFQTVTVEDEYGNGPSDRDTPVSDRMTAGRAPPHERGNYPTNRLGEIEEEIHRKRNNNANRPRKQRRKMNGYDPESGDDLERYFSPAEEVDDDEHSGEFPQVLRGTILIKNAIDTTGAPKVIDIVEGEDSDDEIVVEDNVNMFHGSYFQSRENPMYNSDQDLSQLRETETRSRQPAFTKIFGGPDEEYREIKVNRGPPKSRSRKTEHSQRTEYSNGYDATDGQSRSSRTQKSEYEISRLLRDAPAGSIKQTIDVQREEEDILGPLPANHADGSNARPEDMLNFDTVSEKVDMGLRDGKAEVAVKVRCERIVPIRGVEDMFKKSSVIVTRLIVIDLFVTEERKRLWDNIVRRTNHNMVTDGKARRGINLKDTKLSTKETFSLYKTFMGLAEADEAGKRGGHKERMRIDRKVDESRHPELYADGNVVVDDEDDIDGVGYDTEQLDQQLEENLVRSFTSKKLEPDTMSYMSAASETHDMLY